MELRHFRYAVAVADTLHFGRAAEQLHISQPPLSQQIRQLEDELGVRLFDRTQRRVQLTAAGELFVQEARLVLTQVDHASKVGERIRQGEEGQLFIGVAGPADADYFVDIMRTFAQRHPHVRVTIRNMSTAEQVRAIQEKRLHAGFVTPPVDDAELVFETVLHEPIVLALPRGHALAARPRVPLAVLADEPVALPDAIMGPCLFEAASERLSRAGVQPEGAAADASTTSLRHGLVAAAWAFDPDRVQAPNMTRRSSVIPG